MDMFYEQERYGVKGSVANMYELCSSPHEMPYRPTGSSHLPPTITEGLLWPGSVLGTLCVFIH